MAPSVLSTGFIDIHTHQPGGTVDSIEIENLYFGQKETGKATYCSAGLHPWYLQDDTMALAVQWLKARAAEPGVIAIGEAGLDRTPSTPWPLQLSAFRACIDLSESAGKPLVIHCVRAFSDILALRKELKPHQPWILHGFDKNRNTARMMLDAGCYLSFGAALFKRPEVFAFVPEDRFFLETDDSGVSIREVYARAAECRGVELPVLQSQVRQNFNRVFAIQDVG